MGLFERYLSVWIALAIVVGVGLGGGYHHARLILELVHVVWLVA